MLKLGPPERLDFSKPFDWPNWKQNFLRFRLTTKLHKEEGAVQVSVLIYTMGREAGHVFKSLTLAEGDDAKIGVIFAKSDLTLETAIQIARQSEWSSLMLQIRILLRQSKWT